MDGHEMSRMKSQRPAGWRTYNRITLDTRRKLRKDHHHKSYESFTHERPYSEVAFAIWHYPDGSTETGTAVVGRAASCTLSSLGQ